MAKKFRFRLAVVERVRAEKEQALLRVLASAQKKVIDCQSYRAGLDQALQSSLLRREQLGANATEIVNYQVESEFVFGQKLRITQADQSIWRAKKQLEKVLREYLVAKRALRAVEVLKEKALQDFKLEQRKKEQKANEDLYVLRSARAVIERETEREALAEAEASGRSA